MWNEEKKDGKENKIEINRVDRTNGKGGCMLMERKKIVKWENGELHSMRYVGGRNEFGEGGIVLLEAELVVYFRGEYHFNYNRGP